MVMNLLKLPLVVFAVVAGVFICPLLLALTPTGKLKLTLLDGVFGNAQDSINGDSRWYPAWVARQGWFIRTFPRYWWIAIRNPAQNLRLALGAAGVVSSLYRNKPNPHTLGTYIARATIGGKRCAFYYHVGKWAGMQRYFRIVLGPKIWEDAKVDHPYSAIFGFSLLPFITKDTASV